MAALAFPDVIADITSLFLALQANFHPKTEPTCEVTPLPILAPAPQRPAADFATVLGWEASEDDLESNAPIHTTNDGYLKSGGVYIQRVLAAGRIIARYATECQYAHAMSEPSLVNQAPPWPPAPEHIASSPDWGQPKHPDAAVAPQAYSPEVTYIDATELFEDEHDHSWLACGHTDFALHVMGDRRKEIWDTELTSCTSEDSEYDGCATGFFIGHDGTAWPLPPRECMPGSHPLPYEPLDAPKPRRSNAKSPGTVDTALCGALRLLGVEAGARTHCPSAAVHRGKKLPVLPPTTRFRRSVSPESSSSSSMSSVSLRPLGPETPFGPGLDMRAGPGLDMHVSPDPSSFAELGRQWYASFGKDLHPPTWHRIDSRGSGASASSAMGHSEGGCAHQEAPREPDVGEVFHLIGSPQTPPGLRVHEPHGTRANLWAYISGRDGSPWPCPPSPPVPYSYGSPFEWTGGLFW
ncbi:hypothetical protein OH77DRAFT_1517041 [Trametes cingulata]|nr:hypothetical protein OH77DRAFT_1517041 [Trametes cingulata]